LDLLHFASTHLYLSPIAAAHPNSHHIAAAQGIHVGSRRRKGDARVLPPPLLGAAVTAIAPAVEQQHLPRRQTP